MKKLNFVLAVFILAIGSISCEKQDKHNLGIDAMDATKATSVVELGISSPVSDGGVAPEIIPGENPGGNRTCEEVYDYYSDLYDGPYLCGDKVDYDEEGDGFGDGFDHYPGLEVSVDGVFVSFEVTDCIEIDGEFYKVGAVIVKGSNAANVYFYPEGSTGDSGLAAPGGKRMVSNLTFCFVPCEPEKPTDWVIAFKSPVDNGAGVSGPAFTIGIDIPNDNNSIGYNELGFGEAFDILLNTMAQEVIATITATEVEHEGVPHILVVVEAEGWEFTDPHLYIGTLESLDGRPYWLYPFDIDDVVDTPCEFLIPVADITL